MKEKGLKARVYDFDPSYDPPDGSDIFGDYVIRDVDYIMLNDDAVMLKNGLQTRSYIFVESEA